MFYAGVRDAFGAYHHGVEQLPRNGLIPIGVAPVWILLLEGFQDRLFRDLHRGIYIIVNQNLGNQIAPCHMPNWGFGGIKLNRRKAKINGDVRLEMRWLKNRIEERNSEFISYDEMWHFLPEFRPPKLCQSAFFN
jgi:hypothetical protein